MFNKGALDLTGRHEHRYVSLMERWKVLSQALDRIEELEGLMEGDNVAPDINGQTPGKQKPNTNPVEDTAELSRLRAAFVSKWHLRDLDVPTCQGWKSAAILLKSLVSISN